MRRWAAISGAVALVVFGIAIVRPFLARDRPYAASVPSPPAVEFTSTVPLAPGAPVCWRDAVIEQHAQVAQVKVTTNGRRSGPPLLMSLDGPGYRTAIKVPGGYLDDSVLSIPVPMPPAPVPLHVCVSNQGTQTVALFSSADRTRSRSHAFVAGRDTYESVWLSFYETKPTTIPERLDTTLHRMTIFRPGYVGYGLLRVLFWLFLLGVPVAVIVAFVRAVGEDEAAVSAAPVGARSRWRRWLD
jgi:hypothetical protein